jgi:hypothetical protein
MKTNENHRKTKENQDLEKHPEKDLGKPPEKTSPPPRQFQPL